MRVVEEDEGSLVSGGDRSDRSSVGRTWERMLCKC
jgi:hypothetical protein